MRSVIAAVLLFLISGCATPIPGAKKDLLEFLQVGQTTREEVLTHLGQPSGTFEQDRILTYRLGFDGDQGYYLISPKPLMPWRSVRFSFVVVFDDKGVLRNHKMIEVQ